MQRRSSCLKTHTAVLTTCPVMRVRRDGRHIGSRLPNRTSSWSTAECSTGQNIKRDPISPFPERAVQIWAAFLLLWSSNTSADSARKRCHMGQHEAIGVDNPLAARIGSSRSWAREAAVSHLGEHWLRSRRPHQRIAAGASKKVLDVQGWIGCFRKALCV
jgi:hypothetical protein